MRIGIDAEGRRVFSEGLHNGQAWQCTPEGSFEHPDEAPAAALRSVEHNIEVAESGFGPDISDPLIKPSSSVFWTPRG